MILARISGLPPMANGENQHDFFCRLEAVERNVPGTATGDHQLPQPQFAGPADEGMAFENPHGFLDQRHGLGRGRRLSVGKEVGQSLQVAQCTAGIDQPRQGFTLGLAGFSPDARLRR